MNPSEDGRDSAGQLPFSEATQVARWATSTVPEHRCLTFWADAICQAYGKARFVPHVREGFDASLSLVVTGGLTISRSVASAQRVWSLAETQSLFLATDPTQPWTVEQGGAVHPVAAGDVAIVDANTPWCFDFPQRSLLCVLELPIALVQRWLPTPHSTAPRIVRGERGWPKVLAVTCTELGHDLQNAAASPPQFLESTIGGLLAACVGYSAEPTAPLHDLVKRAVAVMKERLHEPGLSIDDISCQLGISARTLHRAFADLGDTPSLCLRRLRIERAEELLASPRMLHVLIEEIARRTGFASASHFAREFRRVCGTTPQRWRAARHHAEAVDTRREQLEDCDRRIELASRRVDELNATIRGAHLSGRVRENALQLLVETEKYLVQLRRIRALHSSAVV